MRKQWLITEQRPKEISAFARALQSSEVIASLLLGRGITTRSAAENLFKPSIDQLHEPFLMRGMKEAIARALLAIDGHEKILIYGDYDVDGTTGTILLRRVLKMLGAETGYHVPHRFTEGYGINREALEEAQAHGYSLVISVDCGMRAHEPLRWAKENGLDVIVTDHHLPEEAIPPAVAILNPNQMGCEYPDKHLAGVGVAFKFSHALLRAKGREKVAPGLLKIAAIGTIADVAPLIGENRIIVSLGLESLSSARNMGLRALMKVAGFDVDRQQKINASDIGFRIGPRINAAGRMDIAHGVIELFESDDAARVVELATYLDTLNRERQQIQQELIALALKEFDFNADEKNRVMVLAGTGWHRGVIGLVAAKLAERFHRPCVIISLDEAGIGHGSARSIESYHLLDGITSCTDLLENFGGHAFAAGLTIRNHRIEEFRERINHHAALKLSDHDLQPVIKIDHALAPETLSLALVREVKRLAPFGAGWPEPLFVSRQVRVNGETRIIKDRHLKFSLRLPLSANTTDRDKFLDAIWWNGKEKADFIPCHGSCIDIVYRLEQNSWNDRERLQLVIEDMRAANGA